MLAITRMRIRSLDVDYWQLSWQLEPTQEDVLDYTFQVLRSESHAGPFVPVSDAFSDRYVFFDRIIVPFHPERVFFYKLAVRNRVTGASEEFGPYDPQPESDLIAREMRRHFQLLFREFSGRRCWLLPVRTFGQRCPGCWVPGMQQRTRSGCVQCYDTGFARGYHHPIEIWCEVETGSPRTRDSVAGTPKNSVNTSMRCVDVGVVKVGDVLVEGENRRWRVTTVNSTEHGRATILYDLGLFEIPPGDVEFQIPLDLGMALKDLWLSPARNFTNPHNLGNFGDEEIPDIFNLYPGTYTDPNR
jgi:hypothetical protein